MSKTGKYLIYFFFFSFFSFWELRHLSENVFNILQTHAFRKKPALKNKLWAKVLYTSVHFVFRRLLFSLYLVIMASSFSILFRFSLFLEDIHIQKQQQYHLWYHGRLKSVYKDRESVCVCESECLQKETTIQKWYWHKISFSEGIS